MRDKSDLYFECHVTFDPSKVLPGGDSFLQAICDDFEFRIATFNIVEGKTAKGFVSARDQSYSRLLKRMMGIVRMLMLNGYNVTRYKIEDTIIDSNNDSDAVLGLLK